MSDLTLFDAYEIAPVRKDDQYDCFEVCAPSKAQFWTLYGHIPTEGVEAIADLKTKKDCEDLLYRITGHRNYFLNAEEERDPTTPQGESIKAKSAKPIRFTSQKMSETHKRIDVVLKACREIPTETLEQGVILEMTAVLEKLLCRWNDYLFLANQAGEKAAYIEQAQAYGSLARACLAKVTGKTS